MGTQRVQVKVVLPWWAPWACRAGTRDFCPTLAALVPTVHYFNSFIPIAHQAGQAVVLGRQSLSIRVSGLNCA